MLLGVRSGVTAHIPWPIAGLQLVAVHESTGAALDEGTAEDAHIVLTAVTRMWVVAELFWAIKVDGLGA